MAQSRWLCARLYHIMKGAGGFLDPWAQGRALALLSVLDVSSPAVKCVQAACLATRDSTSAKEAHTLTAS